MQLGSVLVSDDRKVAYAEYGDLTGIPVFSFHGTPGCRLRPESEIKLVEQLGIHLIVPDRPGYGQSDFAPNRTLLDWADDVIAIADALGISQFGIVAYSGGGPHAAACAYKIPHRLTRVALVSGLGPVVLLGESRQPMTKERREFKAQQISEDPEAWLNFMIENISGPDGEQIKAQGAWRTDYMLEAYRQGVDGTVYDETLILTQSWGFDLNDITADVYLWQGELDANVQVEQGRFMAENIPNCTATFVPEAGHLMPSHIQKDIFTIFVDRDTKSN